MIVIFYLPVAAAILNVLLLRHIYNSKQETIMAAKEVLIELRNLAQRANRQHRQVMTTIQDLRTELRDGQDALMNIFNDGKSNQIVMGLEPDIRRQIPSEGVVHERRDLWWIQGSEEK